MKYKIEVYGKGGEAFIHKLTEDQYETLQDNGVEDDLMDHEQISEVLGTDFLETEEIMMGIYTGGENIHLVKLFGNQMIILILKSMKIIINLMMQITY